MSKKINIQPGKILKLVLSSLLKKPATLNYPFQAFTPPPNFRGKLTFHADKCIGCLLCMKDCPSKAITIKKVGDKKFEAEIDLGKCVYCAQCVDSCPRQALAITPQFELAQIERDKLKVVFRAEPAKPDQPAKQNEPANQNHTTKQA